MICPKCGNTIRDNAKFCTTCGYKIETAPVQPSVPPVQPLRPVRPVQQQAPQPTPQPMPEYRPVQPPVENWMQEETAPPRKEKPRKGLQKGVIIACIATAVIIVAAILLILILGKDKDQQPEGNGFIDPGMVSQPIEESSAENENTVTEESGSEEESPATEGEEDSVTEEGPTEEEAIALLDREIEELDDMDFESNYESEEELFEMLLERAENSLESGDPVGAQKYVDLCKVLSNAVMDPAQIRNLDIESAEWDGNGTIHMKIKVSTAGADIDNKGFAICESAAGTTVYNEVYGISVDLPKQQLQYVSVDETGKGSNNKLFDNLISACDTAAENQVIYVVAYTDGPDAVSETSVEAVINKAKEAGIQIYMIGVGSQVDSAACRQMTSATGGSYLAVADEDGLSDALASIGELLERTYTVQYTSIFSAEALKDASVCIGYLGSGEYSRAVVEYAELLALDEEEEDSEKEEEDEDEYILPESGSRYLTTEEVRSLSKEELRLARNEIYARKGRRFKDAGLQEYFDSKSWYEGTIDPDSFSNSLLNKYEIANIELIQSYE